MFQTKILLMKVLPNTTPPMSLCLVLLASSVGQLPSSPLALLLPDAETHTRLVLQEPAMALLHSLGCVSGFYDQEK